MVAYKLLSCLSGHTATISRLWLRRNRRELSRVKAARGEIDDEGYINGQVQVSRSIGDYSAKFVQGVHNGAIIPNPFVIVSYIAYGSFPILNVSCQNFVEFGMEPAFTWLP